ncbi:FtsX-like permease family protein [uncultured Arthrobacter sp.]|uniref:FtsX-like permease family protein n=1 Tax=uncultured Arthrobacter sp. TaxID=114050 RepID=UPI0026277625|nr:ABC transporter permease [uncultured Arthrobacter sp.]
MRLVHLASRRASARRSLLAIIALTLAVLTAVLAGISGFTQLAATEALRSLAAAPGAQGFFRIHTTIADDDAAQQAAADSAFAELGLPNGLAISTAPYSPPRPLVPSGGTATNLPADLTFLPVGWTPTTTPAAGSLATFAPEAGTEGADTQRTGPVPAALEASTAESLGLAIGDTFAVEGAAGTVRLELVATLTPRGPDAAFLNPVPVQGAETVPTAVVVPPDAIPTLSGEPKVQWVFTVNADSVSAAELSRLAEGLRQLPQRLSSDTAVNDGGVIPSGELAGLLASAADATQSVRAVLPIALLLLVALSAVTVVQFARLLADTRAVEDKLISARGSTTGQRAAVAAFEIVPLVIAGCGLGWIAAVVLGPLLSSGNETNYLEGMGEFASASWTVPVLCAGITALVFVGVAVLDALREHSPGADAARTARVASFGVLALLLAATVLSLWQFLLYRSPLVESGSGALRVNPLAAPAPALLLLAGTALALVITSWLARRVERQTASRATLGVPLAARQVSRRIASYVIPIALVTVTVGTATFTAAYAQTTSRSQEAASQLGNGSDVRVAVPGPLVIRSADDVPQLSAYADSEAVTAASLAYRGEARLASITSPLLAVDAASLPGLLSDGANLLDVGVLAAALAFEPPVPEPALTLTPSATQVRMQFTSTGTSETADDDGATRTASVTVWIRTEAGNLVPVPAGTLALSGAGDQAHSLSFALPEGLRPTAIAAIDVALEPSETPRGYELEITSVSSDGGTGTGQGRFTEDSSLQLAVGVFGAAQSGVQPLDEGVGVRFPEEGSTAGTAQARLMLDVGDSPSLPVALTAELLADLDLAVGDPVSLRPGGVEIQGIVAAVAPVLPGTTESTAVLADLQAYSRASLASSPAPPRPGEIWLASSDRGATAAAAAGIAGPGATVSTADNSLIGRFLAPAATSLWIGAIGALLVGGAALTASIVTLVQSRRSEVAVLRALGMQAQDQVRGRRWEVLSVGGAAVVLGLLTGLGVAALTVSLLAQAVVVNASEALRAPLSIAVVPLLGVLAVQVLILVLTAWFYGERVKRQALTPALAVDAL